MVQNQNIQGNLPKTYFPTSWLSDNDPAASVLTSWVLGQQNWFPDAGGAELAKLNFRPDPFAIWTDPFAHIHACICILIYTTYRRLGGVSSPLGRPPRNREIVSCRACVRAVGLPGGNEPKSSGGSFPFSLWEWDPFPFPL